MSNELIFTGVALVIGVIVYIWLARRGVRNIKGEITYPFGKANKEVKE